ALKSSFTTVPSVRVPPPASATTRGTRCPGACASSLHDPFAGAVGRRAQAPASFDPATDIAQSDPRPVTDQVGRHFARLARSVELTAAEAPVPPRGGARAAPVSG